MLIASSSISSVFALGRRGSRKTARKRRSDPQHDALRAGSMVVSDRNSSRYYQVNQKFPKCGAYFACALETRGPPCLMLLIGAHESSPSRSAGELQN